ncbi:MAG: sugar phosphate isomerase/epimerase [Candidatus Micrarchaeota archaeon]|nr:sugar phosphate isomerase/epimerase [Candidatus Micrarchaeota archaeon]
MTEVKVAYGAMNNPRNLVLEEALKIIEWFDYFELTIEPPKAYPILRNIKTRLRDLLYSYDTKIVAHLPWHFHLVYPLKDIQKNYIKHFMRCIDVAVDLEAEFITLHPEFLPHINGDRFIFIKDLKESIATLNEYCKSRGIRLHLENFVVYSYSLEEFYDIVTELDLHITFDVGHANIGYGFNGIKTFIDVMGSKIRHYHIHDNLGDKDTHLPINVGNIDWKRVIGLILQNAKQKDNTKLSFTLEVHSKDREYLIYSLRVVRDLVNKFNLGH